MLIAELHELIDAVCPIIGINSSGSIWAKPEATELQKESANAVMQANIGLLE